MTTPGVTEVETFIGLLVVVACVAALVRVVRLPYTVALVLTGLAIAFLPNAPHLALTPGIILQVFLPVLLFYGSYNLNAGELRHAIRPVVLLAVPGVLATAVLVGAAVHLAAGLSWSEAFLFGTIVAATDPVAVLSIFGELGVPRRLETIVSAESLFNDGTALVLYGTMIGVVTAHTVDAGTTGERFLVEVIGSLALGVAVGIVGSTVVHRIDDALLETAITLIIAYGGYLLATRLSISGPLETVAAGIVLGVRGTDVMSPTTRLQAGATWEFLDFLANSLLFLLMGLAVQRIGEITVQHFGVHILWPLVVAILAVVLSRFAVVAVLRPLIRWDGRPLSRAWAVVVSWSGLRGAVSFAAALGLPASVLNRNLMLTLTFGVVVFTLLVQGLTMQPLLARLGIGGDEENHHALDLLVGKLRTVEAGRREIELMQRDDLVDPHLAKRLADDMAAEEEALRGEIEHLYHGDLAYGDQQEHELRRRLLRVQEAAARTAFARGQISRGAFRELTAEIDAALSELDVGPE
jgi:CPA1 family monovalent cation:H+ antiporter